MAKTSSTSTAIDPIPELQKIVLKHWGYSSLRPLQEQSMRSVMEGRDSLLVLPTGGGKSLCYQAPAVLRGGTTVVISPLIALMKDQVDGLRANGISAVQLNSGLTPEELRRGEEQINDGSVRLLFASPERMATTGFRRLLKQIGVKSFAIDEAHCISHWGHDFRPEYRQLNRLKELFPEASVHAYTATATEQVRNDIVAQLGLRDPQVFVGDFDRPNLTYRILSRQDVTAELLEVVERHKGEAGIVYCIRRKDVDDICATLRAEKVNALPYHAGLSTDERKKTQEAFAEERCDVVVATVAFGMGIDRSNIRYVLHTGMPKSIEAYQQETGRAGRDGLEAECVLLYSPADAMLWRTLVEKSVGEAKAEVDPDYMRNSLKHIADMEAYCRPTLCRHRKLVEYFGQAHSGQPCQACDLCLGDHEAVADAQTVAKKILSCVARVKENFGVNHVISVLRGENIEAIRKRGHDDLSTFGLLSSQTKTDIRDWIHQLIGQEALLQVGDEYPVLKLNAASWEVMKDQRIIELIQSPRAASSGKAKREKVEPKKTRSSQAAAVSWEGVDRELFDALRVLRREMATERGVPPYVIFSDATLRELARIRPSSMVRMHMIYGIGETKLRDFGQLFLDEVNAQCLGRGLSRDN